MKSKIKVLLVDDSPLVLSILGRYINADPRMEVLATATSGREALLLLEDKIPDIICTDVQMPGMDGLELIRTIANRKQIPILVVSIGVQPNQKENTFRLLEAGAVDVFPKPRANVRLDESEIKNFCDRVFIVSKVHVVRNRINKAPEEPQKTNVPLTSKQSFDVVLMGGSTGSPQIYHYLFSNLDSAFITPIVAVQHISEGFTQSFVDWLNRSTQVTVKIAEQGEILKARHIYFPPDNTHIRLTNGRVQLDKHAAPNCGSRPSVNVLFDSIADSGSAHNVLAILLSGMGRDGADSMLKLRRVGATTLAQSKETCAIFGMPNEAVKLNAVDEVLSPADMVKFLNSVK